MDQKDKASLLPSPEAASIKGTLLSGAREEEAFQRWLERVEYPEGGSGPIPGRMTRLMLVLNAIGLVTHTGAFFFEVAYGARFNMYLQLYYNEVTSTTHNTSGLTHLFNNQSSITTYTYTRVVAHDVYITWVAVWIHFLSMGFHACICLFLGLSYAYPGIADWYLWGMFKCRASWRCATPHRSRLALRRSLRLSPLRWAEYFVSASLMIYLLTIMMGVRDTAVITATTGLCGVTILFGWITEVASSRLIVELDKPVPGRFGYAYWYRWKDDTFWDRLLYIHLTGYIPFTLMFYIILDSFFKHRSALGDAYPGYTDYTVVGTLFLFLLFGATQFLQQLHDYGPSWYALGEASYVALSFLAKAWLVVIVTLQALANEQFDQNLNAKFS